MQNEQKPEKSKMAENEEKILAFWEKNEIFKKSLEKPSPKGQFVFYDGPPFATGEPHYGHIVPGTIKDIIPRYKTMRGYYVKRRWGWDCHGLPVENIVEKELELGSKKDILEYGIEKFNAMARESVMRYAEDWRRIIPRLGRWVDMNNDYRTMDASYTESVWWAFSELYKKGLIYEGFKSMNLCPRCETTLSNFEVNLGYKDITDIFVYVKFKLLDQSDEESPTYFLAWTTTPWTLPGNSALAVNANIEYAKVQIANEKFIIAKNRLSVLKKEYKILEEIKGENFIGKSYEAVFPYYFNDKNLKNHQNGWKVYGADFVTTEDGTGIVHVAPAFGSDDYDLSLKYSLPFIQHIATNGTFKKEVIDFQGQPVKPKDTNEEKDNHQKADIEIIKYLAHHNSLFEKEKIVHSYAHCWRCETPLLNYASSSWFVKVTALRHNLVKENKKIQWIPPEIGQGRFGNWLANAHDWAISRSRFWGAPLPVWKVEKTDEYKVISGLEELKKYSHSKNTYYITRHGEAENNTKRVISSVAENSHHLTEKGKKQAEEIGIWLKDKKIDLVFVSPFIRTRETADIIGKILAFDPSKIIIEPRIHELNAGVWNGKPFDHFVKNFAHADRFIKTPEGGENYADIKKRMGDVLYDLEKKYKDKNILIISHDTPLFLLTAVVQGLDRKQSIALRGARDHYNQNAKPSKLDFCPLPHNSEYELDLHKPFIDDLELVTLRGNKLIRVPEVFDCWFESGSMPFAEYHYPFDRTEFDPSNIFFRKSKGYPADFIAEGLDQTRGWFYSMIVLSVALFGKSAFKRVVVNGQVLAEDGQKMSKSKNNFPDLIPIINKYGADALRYYLMSSPVVRGQDFVFLEKGIDEVVKKHIGRLNNVVTFYEMYATVDIKDITSTDRLDIWIVNRFAELASEVTLNLEKYEIDRAIRPFADFIDDLSTWYIRRSRDRFKGDDEKDKIAALATTRTVLINLSKLIAPFMPFLAEDIYVRLKGGKESVHLEEWPAYPKADHTILTDMKEARRIASLGLEARMKAKINVRQPLSKLTVKSAVPRGLVQLIQDEINVKEVIFNSSLSQEVVLDVSITPELKEEGTVRELVRAIQDLRKERGLTIHDHAVLVVDTDEKGKELIIKNKKDITRVALLSDIRFETVVSEAKNLRELSVKLNLL